MGDAVMKSTSLAICLVCIALSAAMAAAGDVSFDGSLGLYSSYIWRGYKLSEDALQVQPSATVGIDGFGLNVWADYDFDTEQWLEVDYTASFAHDFDGFGLEVGYVHYDVREGLDSDEVYASAGFDSFLNPSLTAFYDVNEGEGAFFVADISHAVELTDRASVEFGASVSMVFDNSYVATDANGDKFTGLFNGHLSATGLLAVTDRLSIEPMVGYTFALSDDASDAIKAGSTEPEDSFLYGAVTVTISF
jgi:hypothetical protein